MQNGAMFPTYPSLSLQGVAFGPALVLLLAVGRPAAASGDDALERSQLAAIVRQLDMIDRLSGDAAIRTPLGRARYHFDYARLHDDIARVRAGMQDYLVPQRAQPRDPVPLTGDYVRNDVGESVKASPP